MSRKMKIKAKELIKRFKEAESQKDYGGMDPDLAKECAKIALEYYFAVIESQQYKTRDQYNKIDEICTKRTHVNYATKEVKE